jgi:hypothetical protein
MWSLLVAVDKHNKRVRRGTDGTENSKERAIRRTLMTPLATAVGFWSLEQWAAQTVIVMRHFVGAVERGGGIESPKGTEWDDIQKVCDEVSKTHNR